MPFIDVGLRRRIAAAALAAVSLSMLGGPGAADDKTYVMKITTPTINDAPHQFSKNFAAAVERDSGGRIKAEVYPASQLGPIPRQIEGVQFGAIQCAVIPPDFYVGVDERFEVLAAPGLVDSLAHGQRLSADPAVLKLMLGLGAEKGLHGAGLFMAAPQAVIAKKPIRQLADFKGRRIRIFTSEFQSVAMKRLGAAPIAMTLGDVLPALQQGTIDGAVAAVTVFNAMQYQDAAKYITETNQSAIFLEVEISRKWYEALPKDLQQVIDRDAIAESVAIGPFSNEHLTKSRQAWIDKGGELISLLPNEQSAMMESLASVGEDVSRAKPALNAAFGIVAEAAQRTR